MWIETRHHVRLPSLPQQLFTPFVNHLLRRLPADDQSRKFQIAAPTNTDPVGTGMGDVEPAISVVILVVAQAPQYHREIPTPKRGGGGPRRTLAVIPMVRYLSSTDAAVIE